MKKSLFTVWVFTRLNTRRFFRDRLAIFFGVLFPLIFLFVFGGISGGGNKGITFKVALINQSHSTFAREFEKQAKSGKLFKVNEQATTMEAASDKLSKSQIDGIIVLPPDFGTVTGNIPGGEAKVIYSLNNDQAGQTLVSVLQEQFKGFNSKFVQTKTPFSVKGEATKNKSLSSFDYTFAGLLGFSIIGLGIFGPVNVFPELKKQGILRRFNTTPLKVWQYFVSNVATQIIIGLFSLSIMFLVAIAVFDLKVVGNYLEIGVFLMYSIAMILGIGLAIGGWSKNERQAAPLANITVFPMMFLSGTFFPRFLMPEWLQHISTYLPLTPVIDGIRFMTTEGKHLVDLGPQLGLMTIWLVVIYVVAFRVFRWE